MAGLVRFPYGILAALAFLVPATAAAQSGTFAYPNAGQSEEQQSRDRFECHQWAVSQTGFDPTMAPPVQSAQAAPMPAPPPRGYSDNRRQSSGGLFGIGNGGMFQGGGVLGDAATGAALGAAGGAIAGNAGKGAAIGALSTTVFGALTRNSSGGGGGASSRNRDAEYEYYRQQQAQQQAQNDQMQMQRLDRVEGYNRAYGACMKSRNYTVN